MIALFDLLNFSQLVAADENMYIFFVGLFPFLFMDNVAHSLD